MERLLLVSANQEYFPEPVFPLGTVYVASALMQRGISVRILDAGLSAFPMRALRREISTFRPEAIGLSLRNIDNAAYPCTQYYVPHHVRIAKKIQLNSAVPLFLGGSAFSIFPEELIGILGVKAGAVGDGEDGIIRLCNGQEGGIVHTELSDLSTVEFPRTIDSIFPHFNSYRTIGIQTARGCSNRCIYCTYPRLEGKRVRRRSAQAVAEEIAFLSLEHGKHDFFFVDSSFNADESHMASVCCAIIDSALSIRFSCYLQPKMSDLSLFNLLARAGCLAVDFGTDSCSGAVLQALQKGFAVEDIRKTSEACSKAGIDFCHSLLFGAPGETSATVMETIRQMEEIKPKAVVAMTGIRIYPNTEMEHMALREGVISPEESLLAPRFYFSGGDPSWLLRQVGEVAAAKKNWFLPGERYWSSALSPRLLRLFHRKGPLWRALSG